MATEMKMPQLSDTMDKGKILAWKKQEGQPVVRGDILAEVETDKANLEIECFTAGVLLKILTPAGSTANVGEAIALIGQAGESVDTSKSTRPSAAAMVPPKVASTPEAPPTRPTLTATASPSTTTGAQRSAGTIDRVRVSPLARKLAEQHSVDLSVLSGSGPDGRIVKRDVELRLVSHQNDNQNATASAPASPSHNSDTAAPQSSSSAAPRPSGGQLHPLSKMRETIARRMQESVTQAPHFYVTAAIDMDQAVALREVLKERPEFKGISVNHLVIKACSYALSREPRVNRSMRDGMVYEPDAINVGIITAVEDGLLIPVVRNSDKLSLRDVVFESRAAIERARAGRPNSSDLTGGTFSISNMGMFDVENFTAIISPGQGGVLAVSAVRDEPVVRNGLVVPGKRMRVTLSVDHRVIDGVMAAQWLKQFKEAMEVPALLM